MPTPSRWSVPSELSPEETRVAARLHRSGKFYAFLRTIRSELFDDASGDLGGHAENEPGSPVEGLTSLLEGSFINVAA